MNKVFRKIGDSTNTLPYDTLTVEVEKQITVKVQQALWDKQGNHLPFADLTAIGYEIYVTPDQSDEYNEFTLYRSYFTANPDLEPRVQEYKAFFDQLGIGYDSNTDAMETAIKEKIAEAEQLEFIQRMQTALTNVKVNYQAAIAATGSEASGNDFETWLHTPLLVKYMPSAAYPQPEYKEPYVATAETEAAEAEDDEPVNVQ